MKCLLCGELWLQKTIPFSAVCTGCDCWLHSCIQCALWDPDAEMCRSMTTESVKDRSGKNFCEEWQPAKRKYSAKSKPNQGDKFASLFGD